MQSGFMARIDAEQIGRAAMALGAGRARMGDSIDPGAGLVLAVRVGDVVEMGDLLGTLYAASESLLDEGETRLLHAVHVSADRVMQPPLVHEV